MSYNGSGVYTLPGAQLVNGAVVSSTENNQFRNDVATALNVAWTRDGQAPATANIPMSSHKLTGLSAGTNPGDSVRYEQVTSDVDITGGTIDGVVISTSTMANPVYTGTLTGSTGVVNIGSGQIYKAAGGNVGFGTTSPSSKVTSAGIVESTTGGFKFPDGSVQLTATNNPGTYSWTAFTSSGTYTVPADIGSIRVYAFGAGGNGGNGSAGEGAGGGGGCAFGNITVSVGDEVEIDITAGVATVTIDGTTYLTANPGAAGDTVGGGAGGDSIKHASVASGGQYTGGDGGPIGGGGGSSGSPLGNGYDGGGSGSSAGGGAGAGGSGAVGGGGAGGAGYSFAGGGAGSVASTSGGGYVGGIGRFANNLFSDPLMASCVSSGGTGDFIYGSTLTTASGQSASAGGGGGGASASPASGSAAANGGNGGAFGGGGGAYIGSNGGNVCGGKGGFGAGGGGAYTVFATAVGGNGGIGGGGGSSYTASGTSTPGTGGSACVLIYS